MRIEANHNLIHDAVVIDEIRNLVLSKYFGLVVTQEILQNFYDDIMLLFTDVIYNGNVFSELEVGYCPLRNKLWADFNSKASGEQFPIYLEF